MRPRWAAVNTVMIVGAHASVSGPAFSSSGGIPTSGLATSYGNSVFKLRGTAILVLHSGMSYILEDLPTTPRISDAVGLG